MKTLSGPLIFAGGAVAAFVTAALIGQGLRAETEDSAGWDCLRQGNVTCRIDGVLVTSLEGMPDDPYERCLFLLSISDRLGGLGYAEELCSPIASQRG